MRAGNSGVYATPITLIPLSDSSMGPRELPTNRPILMGRQSQCDIQMADQTVSRVHATVECTHGTWYVVDKASRLGTLLNGARLEPERPTELREGDVLSVARWSFKIHKGGASTLANAGVGAMTIIGSSRLAESDGRVETFKSDVLLSRAEQRLHLVLDLSASLHAANDERDLAKAVVKAASKGANYSRAAILKLIPGTDVVTVLAGMVDGKDAPTGFAFSRTLVRAASNGELAKLTSDAILRQAVSIISQGIRSAVCAPIMVGNDVAAYLYVDNSDNDPPTAGDVDSFIASVARIASLALAELSRRELNQRHEQLKSDMTAARLAQERLMPSPEGRIGSLAYSMLSKPGRQVAGDLVDVVDLGDGRVAACLGDVSGKGVGAAMLMAAAQTQLRSTLRIQRDVAKAIIDLNREVVTRLLSDGFISLWVGVFDSNTNQLTYVDAGHSYWVLRTNAEVAAGPTAENLPLGIDGDEIYQSRTIQLSAGDRVTIFSDGVVEQLNQNGAMFKMDGVLDTLRPCGDQQQDAVQLMQTLRTFAATDALSDDVTVLACCVL